MLTSAVRHRLLECHVAVLIHDQLAVHLAVRTRHVHPLVRNQRHARRKFRHGHGNILTGKNVVVVTGHVALHFRQVGAFHRHRHRSSIAHLVAVSVRHRELESISILAAGSREIIVELSRLRIQRHGLSVHIERPVLAVIAVACNLLTAVHGKLDLRAFAVVRAEVEVHRTIDAFSVCAVEFLHLQRRHVVHDVHVHRHGVGVASAIHDGHFKAVRSGRGIFTCTGRMCDGVGERVVKRRFTSLAYRAELAVVHRHDGIAFGRRPGHRLARRIGVRTVLKSFFIHAHGAGEGRSFGLGDTHLHRSFIGISVGIRHHEGQRLIDRHVGLGRKRILTRRGIKHQRAVVQIKAQLAVFRDRPRLTVYRQALLTALVVRAVIDVHTARHGRSRRHAQRRVLRTDHRPVVMHRHRQQSGRRIAGSIRHRNADDVRKSVIFADALTRVSLLSGQSITVLNLPRTVVLLLGSRHLHSDAVHRQCCVVGKPIHVEIFAVDQAHGNVWCVRP